MAVPPLVKDGVCLDELYGVRVRSPNWKPGAAGGGEGASGLTSTWDGDDADDGVLMGVVRSLMVALRRTELLLLDRLLRSRYIRCWPLEPSVTMYPPRSSSGVVVEDDGFLSSILAASKLRRSTCLQRRLPTARRQGLVVSMVSSRPLV